MTRHFFDSCRIGSSTFLCPTCKKISDKIDSTLKQTETKLALHEAKIVAMESRFLVVELERNALAEKVKIIEEKTNNQEDKIVWLEEDVEIGTEKAMEDYKENLGENILEKEEGEEDVAVYRVEEWKDDEVEDKEEMVDQLQQQYDKWNEKDRIAYSFTQNSYDESQSKEKILLGQDSSVQRELSLIGQEKTDTKILFRCQDCGLGLGSKKDLTQHQSIHSGEKPFKCLDCGKGFWYKKLLTWHKKIHLKDSSVSQESGSIRQEIKKRAQSNVKEKKPFECLHCGMGFGSKKTLSKHQRIQNSYSGPSVQGISRDLPFFSHRAEIP